ncbi:MAG: hypothetical protein AB7O57_02930 [Hyphomicrobiaceae bacterium]
MSTWQRIALGIVIGAAALVLVLVSISANVKFAMSWADDGQHKLILAGASVAADIFKAGALAIVLYLIAKRAWASALSIAVLGLVALAFSLVSATGFVAGDRYRHFYEATSARNNTIEDRQLLQAATIKRDWMQQVRPISVIEADIAAQHADPSWSATKGCTAGVIPGRREELCRRVGQLSVEMAAAKEAISADKKIEAARTEIRKHGREYGDPLVETIRAFIAIDERTILLGLIVLAVLLIEVGSALGPTVALALLAPRQAKAAFLAPRVPMPSTVKEAEVTIIKPANEASPPRATPPSYTPPRSSAKPPASVRKAAASFKKPAAGKPEGGGFGKHLQIRPAKRSDLIRKVA